MLLSKNKALAKILLEHGLITEKQLKKAQALKKSKRRSLDKTLVNMGIIAKKQLKGLRQAVLYYLIRQADKFYGKIASQSQIVEERYVREALEEQKRLHLEEKRLVRLSKLLISSHNITPKADKAIQEALHKIVIEAKEARRKSQKNAIARATKGLRRGRGLVDSTDAQSGDLEAVTREKHKKTRLSRSDDALADVELIDSDSEIEVEDALESVEELEELEGIEELSEDMFEDVEDDSEEEIVDASDEEVLEDSEDAADLLDDSDEAVAGPPPLTGQDDSDALDELDELEASDEPGLDESDEEVLEDSEEEELQTEINELREQSDLPVETEEVVDLDALSDPELEPALDDSDAVEEIEPADSVEEVLSNLSDDAPDDLKDLEQIEDDSEVSDLDEIESEAELDGASEEDIEESEAEASDVEQTDAESQEDKPARKRIPKPRKAAPKKKDGAKSKSPSGKLAKFLSGRSKSSFKKPLVPPKRRPRKR